MLINVDIVHLYIYIIYRYYDQYGIQCVAAILYIDIMTNMASNALLQWAESVDFNGVGFILIKSTVFEIYLNSTHPHPSFFCLVLGEVLHRLHLESYDYNYCIFLS